MDTFTRRGGDWLVTDTAPHDVFTPERLSDEQRLIAQTTREFVDQEVLPAIDDLETKNWALARSLVKRSGDLGLLGTDVPERFGGVGLDKASAIVVGEAIGASSSFATTFGAQTGLAIIPILCFGTDAQQDHYLPRIVSGDLIGAYCLSESGSGSDALSARTRATRQPDGSWRLTGEKMWITNGGFADLFIVFAKVDGEQFSAFLVERGFAGVSTGQEEHKMGLLGSSTTPLILQDAHVPAQNLLGEIGKGHKIAFNVLNYGRFKLAGMCSGGAKLAIAEAAAYASARYQFGQPIASFGAIRYKLAEMTIRQFALESMLYRTTGLIDAMIANGGETSAAALAALEEFAIEASILKVAGSEMLDYVLDENVQIHGGNGFVHDYHAERYYRDARVNRIFEGTNEINRLLIPGMLVKREIKGGAPILAAARALRDEVLAPPAAPATDADPLSRERRAVAGMKKVGLMILGLVAETYGAALDREQEVLMIVSDMLIDAFASDSVTLRAAASPDRPLQTDAALTYVHDATSRVDAAARTALGAMLAGDGLRTAVAALSRLLKPAAVNTVGARRRIADAVTAQRRYIFD
jgi:alkylation response protein AidB-like acyl-CoA dehydrogenase